MHSFEMGRLSRAALVERWRDLLRDPCAPESCELDRFGEVEPSPPPSFRHQRIVASLGRQLEAALGGESGSFALATDDGVRFPDVCWAPDFQRLAAAGQADPLTVCRRYASRYARPETGVPT